MIVILLILLITLSFGYERYERKAVLTAEPLVRFEGKVKVRVIVCPEGGALCVPVGNWTYKPEKQLKKEIGKTLITWIVTTRFDKLILERGKITLITARETITKPAEFGYGDIKGNEAFINKKIAPLVGNLLRDALEVRYEELPYEEQELFINTKAKELGIPAEIIERLMGSAFLFTFRVKKVEINMLFHRQKVKRGKKKHVHLYTTSVVSKASVELEIYKFDPEKNIYVPYKKLHESGLASHTETFPFIPATLLHIKEVVDRTVLLAVKATALNLRMKLKRDDNFAIFTVVENVKGAEAKAKIGILEDLRIDAPYIAIRNINGERKKVGLLKAVDVADNCKKDAESGFRIINGSVEKGDIIREYPWSGIFLDLGYGRYPYVISEDQIWEGDLSLNTFIIGLKGDMGYITNRKVWKEVWTYMNLYLGFGKAKTRIKTLNKSFETGFSIGADMGVGKRIYLFKSGIYTEPSLTFLFRSYRMESLQGDELDISTLSFVGSLEFGYTPSPDSEIFLRVVYPLVSGTQVNIDTPFLSGEVEPVPQFKKVAFIYGGIRFAIPNIGLFASIFGSEKRCK